ncbi:MAG: small nuclear ribonucleoprotein, LSM family [halophilic archaeon J07HX5]|nr:MAG: small nuclear ribonucleoprotein, LSM family [halophilic archaeon J07HX5]
MDDAGARPLDVLEQTVGTTVRVELKDGAVHEGELVGYDQHMNLVLNIDEDTTIIRGDNVISVQR